MADTYSEGVCRRPVAELRPGDRVDLEGDVFADPDVYADPLNGVSEHPEFEFEFQVVEAVVPETDECTRVEFEGGFVCGFAPDHMIEVDGEQEREAV
jgi:hypothetical protein